MKNNLITHEGNLSINEITIPCYVLENGTRVLSQRGMQVALKMVDAEDNKPTAGGRLIRHLNQVSLHPFFYKDKDKNSFKPLICYKGETKIHGYEATILADICDAFLEARKHIELSQRQTIIAEQCEILIRAFAKVGIIALVDEATGYQYDRERDELQKILKAYINEELLPWEKQFPDIFYKELFRLNKWDFTVKGINKRPGVIGTWTNRLIYNQLPNGVLDELKRITPKNDDGKYIAKLHQSLTYDVGNPHLQNQITKVITLFQISDNMKQMWIYFKKLTNNIYQPSIFDDFDDKGYTKD